MPSRREGSIIQRARGSWQIRYYSPHDANGKQKRIIETVRGLKSDAEKALRDRLATIEKGGYVARDKETVADFLRRWLDTYATSNCTPRTREGYQGNITRYILPNIGWVELQKLTPAQIWRPTRTMPALSSRSLAKWQAAVKAIPVTSRRLRRQRSYALSGSPPESPSTLGGSWLIITLWHDKPVTVRWSRLLTCSWG